MPIIFSSNKSYCQQEQKSSDITSQPKRSLKSILKKNWENQMNLMKTWYKNQQFFQEIMKQNLSSLEYLNLREVESLA